MGKYLNKTNLVTFIIVVLAVIAAPMVMGWINSARRTVTGQ